MPVIRNPFRRNATAPVNNRFDSFSEQQSTAHPAAGRLPLSEPDSGTDEVGRAHSTGAKSVSAISIGKANQDEENTYKLSVVNDSGVYLTPSPPDKKGYWRKNDNSPQTKAPDVEEPFVISRESFESYRRSFDISARSPVLDTSPGRVSFDSRPLAPRTSLDIRSPRLPIVAKNVEPVEEDKFEDIKLNDDARPKRRSIFSRFGTDHSSPDAALAPTSHGVRNGLFGRKEVPQQTVLESELKKLDVRKDVK
ncbi:hypothetical protein C7212DRAFT_280173 [Tuber magnatum]|uniref:Uncharacterized protein n=1 Tax=Tuber magnatum TaxID=42249 RepID=A0A317SSH0_9PEZI|nr:hypothetical protein C7212DRAFT_280173 [Tuber magnatum]